MLFFLTSCASTKVTGEWKDPNMGDQKFEKIMVLGVAKQPKNRRLYEDEFVKQLKAKGVMVVSSRTLISHENMRDKETIVQTIESNGFDGVIISRVGNIHSKQRDYYNVRMYDYYDSGFGMISPYQAGIRTNTQKFGFESNLYDAKTEKLVFSLSSDTYAQDNIHKRLGSYIRTVINKMSQNNLL
jgi:hypothetical protein